MELSATKTECGVSVKTFTIRNKKGNENYNLSNILGGDLFELLKKDFSKFMDDYVIDNSRIGKPNQTCRLYSPNPNFNSTKPSTKFAIFSDVRILCGQLSMGDVDVQKEIRNLKKKTSRYTERNESVLDPFFFLFYLPEKSEKGFIIVEDSVKGAVSILRKVLKAFINNYWGEEVKLKTGDLLQEDYIKTLVSEGIVQTISMTYNTIPAEVADRFGIFIQENDEFEFQVILKAKKETTLGNNVKKKVKSALDDGYYSFFDGADETWWLNETADVKVRAGIDDNKKTIPLKNPFIYKPNYKILVSLDENFRTDYEDMKSQSFKFIKENINPLFNAPRENSDKYSGNN